MAEEIQPQLVDKIKRIEIEPKQNALDLFSGMYRSVFKGKGIEVEDIREYQIGDDIRSISWAKTAQLGRPFVKNYREERDLTVLLVVDISASESFVSHFASKRERSAEIAALIGFSAIYNHDRVGLVLFSSVVEKYIPPKRGLRHGVRLIRELLAFKPKKKGTNIAEALSFINKVARKRLICFLISDFLSEGFDKEFLLAASKEDLIAMRIYDEEEENLPELGLVRIKDLETDETTIVDVNEKTIKNFQALQKERVEKFRKLVGESGADTIELATKGSYREPIMAFFKKRKKRLMK
jgi:uncharacterized protein (DUF58 family)